MKNQILIALPPPMLWQDFEQLTLDRVQFIHNTQNAHKYGNQGSAQNGVDVFCRSDSDGRIGIQCKRAGKNDAQGRKKPGGLKVADLEREVILADGYKGGLDHYIIATTVSRSTKIQDEAERLSTLNLQQGKFSVQVWFWEDYIATLHRSATMLQFFYGNVLQLQGMYSADHQILNLFQMAFSRPAFNVRLCAEDTGTGLSDALADTEQALNIGRLKDRKTKHDLHVAPGGISMLSNTTWRDHANVALALVKNARAKLKKAIDDDGLVIATHSIIVRDAQAAAEIDDLRGQAVRAINLALADAELPEVESDL